MAKKRSRQKRIEGTYEPVPKEVEDQAAVYIALLEDSQRAQKDTDEAREKLLAAMVEHDVERVDLPDYTVLRKHTETDKIKVQKKEDSGGESDDD